MANRFATSHSVRYLEMDLLAMYLPCENSLNSCLCMCTPHSLSVFLPACKRSVLNLFSNYMSMLFYPVLLHCKPSHRCIAHPLPSPRVHGGNVEFVVRLHVYRNHDFVWIWLLSVENISPYSYAFLR